MSVESVVESLVTCEWPSRALVKILTDFSDLPSDPAPVVSAVPEAAASTLPTAEGDETGTEKFLRSEAQSVLDYLKLSKVYKLGEVSLSQIDKRTAGGRLFKAKTPCIALVPKGHSGCFLYRWGCVAEDCVCLPEDQHAIAFLQTRSELWAKKPTEIVTISLEAVKLYKMEQFTACEGCVVWKGLPVEEVVEPPQNAESPFLSGPLDVQAVAEAKLLAILETRRGSKLFEERHSLAHGQIRVPNTSAFRYLVLDVPIGCKLKVTIRHAEFVDARYKHECELDRGDILIMDDSSGVWHLTFPIEPRGSFILYHPEGVGLEDPELNRRSMIGTGMSDSRCIPYLVPKTALKASAPMSLLKHSVRTALLEHRRTAPWMRSAELPTPSEITEARVCIVKTAQFDPTVFAFIAGDGSAVISEEGNGTRLVPVRNLVGSIWWLWPQTTAHLTSSTGQPLRLLILPGKFKPLKIMPERLPTPWGVTVCKRVASPLHLANVPDCEELANEGDAQVSLMPALVCMLEGAPVDPGAFAWRVAIDESGPIANDRCILIPLRLTDKEPGEEPPEGWTSLDVVFAPAEVKVGGHSVRVGDIVFAEGRHVYLLEGTWLVGEATEEVEAAAKDPADGVAAPAISIDEPVEEALPMGSDTVEEEVPGAADIEEALPQPALIPPHEEGTPRKKRRLSADEPFAYP